MANFNDTLIIPGVLDAYKHKAANEWIEINTGVEICHLYKDDISGASAAYIRYAPNTHVNTHSHLGYEHIIVLEGAQQDERNQYPSGCLAIQAPDSKHTISSPSGCVVLAIWSGPLKFDRILD